MKYFIKLIFVASCLVSSYSIAVKYSNDPFIKITEAKKEVMNRVESLVSSGKGDFKDLKEPTLLKKQTFIGSVKAVAKTKLGIISNINSAKSALLKGMAIAKYAKIVAIHTRKSAFIKNYLETKKAHLKKFITKVSTKSNGFFEQKLPIKAE